MDSVHWPFPSNQPYKGYEIEGQWNPIQITYIPTLLKVDSGGGIQWNRNYSSLNLLPQFNYTESLVNTTDGGLAYVNDAGIIKNGSIGNEQWMLNLTFNAIGVNQPLTLSSIIETSDGSLAGLGVGLFRDAGQFGDIYLVKTAPFLPTPSPTQLPTSIPTPTPAPISISTLVQAIVLIILVLAVAALLLLLYRRHGKTSQLKG